MDCKPSRLLYPWNSPGKNTAVGSHSLLQGNFPRIEPESPCIDTHSSVGKESACNAGDCDSVPGSGRSAGEGLGYPRWYSWASLVAQLVKNPSAMWETWVISLGWGDPLEKGKATYIQCHA